MHDVVLKRLRELVRTHRDVLTAHGQEEMESDSLTVLDLEHCILTGHVVERQRDRIRRGWKYLVRGESVQGGSTVTVAKIGPGGTLVVITVYADSASEADDDL